MTNKITAVLISFLRPEYTKECIRSLKEQYPEINIAVAENAEYNEEIAELVAQHGGKYLQMPFDSGVCYARNRLVEQAETEYILVGDDDFFYTDHARVDKMLAFLEANEEYSLIGGRIYEGGNILNYQGNIRKEDGTLIYENIFYEKNRYDQTSGLEYQPCDITFNYFVARRSDILDAKWDENIKVAYEHSDWFLTMKSLGRKVAFTPDCVVVHKPGHVIVSKENQEEYRKYRNRRSDMSYFFEKHQIKSTIGFQGMRSTYKEIKAEQKKYFATRPIEFEGRYYNTGDVIETNSPRDGMQPLV